MQIRFGDELRDVALTFLDCDGVIFDVNAAKTRAFVDALADYPDEPRQALATYHQEHGGLSRYAKFEYFFRELHPVDDVPKATEAALQRFAELSVQGYAELAPRAEALEFAEQMGGTRSVHVVSGSDQAELRRVFDGHGIRQCFAEVLGSPTHKREHMKRLLDEQGVHARSALMVGDGRTDFESARALGVPFVYLAEMSEWRAAARMLDGASLVRTADSWSSLLGWLGGSA
jgi:phosphoglycolate phosphatase-like HAD superfamily hydrolase